MTCGTEASLARSVRRIQRSSVAGSGYLKHRGARNRQCEGGSFPKGPSTQYLRTLVPKANKGMVFGTRVLQYWVLGPSGFNIPKLHAAVG